MKLLFNIFLLITTLFLASCNNEKGIILTTPSRAGGSIIITSQDYNHLGVTRYNLNGEFQEFIKTYRGVATNYPRGLALKDDSSFIVAVDGEDRLETLDFNGTATSFYASNQLSGTIYDVVKGTNYYYVIESSRIERFSLTGVRTSPVYIDTNLGSCSLSTPRHMIINSQGQLVVVQSGGGGDIHTYDVSTDTASCVSSVAFTNTPTGLAEHPDGNLYVVTQGNDAIYRADPDGSNRVVIWPSNTSLINNPNVIVVHPDGDLLIGSNSTHTIEKIQTDGTRVGTQPYIRDVYTRAIYDILIMDGTN